MAKAPPAVRPVAVRDQRPPTRRKALRCLHTFHWKGVCPSCRTLHNAENSKCLNCRSPLVVAFDAKGWNFLDLPVYSAEMCCTANCSVRTEIACTRCGSLIKGPYLMFRFSTGLTLLHQACHALILAGILAIAIPSLTVVLFTVLYGHVLGSAPRLGFALVGLYWTFNWWSRGLVLKWWRFRVWFSFEDVIAAQREIKDES